MLIIKKYHDYYDSAMGIDGIDKTCVYDRSPKLETVGDYFKGVGSGWHKGPYTFDFCANRYKQPNKGQPDFAMPFVIGFCGKTYVGYLLKWATPNYMFSSAACPNEFTEEIVYGLDGFLAKKQFDDTNKYSSGKQEKEAVISYFEKFHNKPHPSLFVKYHVPIFVFDFGTRLIEDLNVDHSPDFNWNNPLFMINPILKNYQFFKIMNTAQTFQEIQMYLQGVLGSIEKEPVQISEKDKIIQHGFDLTWSFRNPCPPKRKQKNVKCNEI